MPGFRTRSAGAKVTEEEYAALEKLAEARGQNVSEWCREAMLRELRVTAASQTEMVGAAAHNSPLSDPALAEIVGVRLLLVNVLGPMAAGETMTQERFNQLLDQISETKHQLAAKLQQQAHEKSRPEKPSGGKR
ncbi:MAG TPA: ribbon-helix-helix protein, CopG family [Terriglobales bacterium]|nr:ribbon-helix-helix protein, CopG family [Terriglobales bacterium]